MGKRGSKNRRRGVSFSIVTEGAKLLGLDRKRVKRRKVRRGR